jgi:hypothetical protein
VAAAFGERHTGGHADHTQDEKGRQPNSEVHDRNFPNVETSFLTSKVSAAFNKEAISIASPPR